MKKHELVAVEYGSTIEDVEDTLIKDVADDLAGDAEYAGCETSAYAPEPIKDFRKVKRYGYEMVGIVYPPHAETNVLIDYGIIEESENWEFGKISTVSLPCLFEFWQEGGVEQCQIKHILP